MTARDHTQAADDVIWRDLQSPGGWQGFTASSPAKSDYTGVCEQLTPGGWCSIVAWPGEGEGLPFHHVIVEARTRAECWGLVAEWVRENAGAARVAGTATGRTQ